MAIVYSTVTVVTYYKISNMTMELHQQNENNNNKNIAE